MTLKEDLAAAFAGDRFTQTVRDIETRAGLRRRRAFLRLSGASIAVVIAVTAGFLWRPSNSPPVPAISPSVSPAPSVNWTELMANCAASWESIKNGPMPPMLFQRDSGKFGIIVYGVGTPSFICARSSYIQSSSVPLYAMGNSLDSLTLFSNDSLIVVGATPAGTTHIEAVNDQGLVLPGEIFGKHFLIWDPSSGFATLSADAHALTLRALSPERVLLRRSSLGVPLSPDAATACEAELSKLPLPGTKSAAPKLRFTRELAPGRFLRLYGDDETLISCRATEASGMHLELLASYQRQEAVPLPSEQLEDVGFVFGRAPQGATQGRVRLASGRTVELSIEDGFYSGTWVTTDLTEIAVSTEIS